MADKINDLFKKTEIDSPISGIDLSEGNVRPTGIGLQQGTIDALKAIGEALGERLGGKKVAVNALVVDIIEKYLVGMQTGKINFDDLVAEWEPEEKPRLRRKAR